MSTTVKACIQIQFFTPEYTRARDKRFFQLSI